jgi:hypothetical protein
VLAICAAVLSGCATVPTGPAIAALPGSRTTPDDFGRDDADCRAHAQAYFSPASTQAANDRAAANVVGGTAIGATVGALIGAATGDAGAGAAIGAGMGLLGGSAVAADTSGYSSGQLQAIYDRAYLECMYARGHRVPSRVLAYRSYRGFAVPSEVPPAAGYPPAGTPPPPRSDAPPASTPPPGGYPPADAPPPRSGSSG